ncbi:MAG: efflux transporter outer membrane subunit [Formosimonas sp.]
MTRFSAHLLRRSVLSAAVLMLTSCALMDKQHQPLQQVSAESLQLPNAHLGNWSAQHWWTQYNDAQLNQLIEQAFAQSPSLQVLATRVEAARVTADGVKKLSYPTGGIKVGLTGQTYSENYIYPPSIAGEWKDSGLIAASLNWDLDLWGRHRAQYRAALGQNAAAQFEYDAARDAIVGNIVGLHAQIGVLATRLNLLDTHIQLQQQAKQRWLEREQAGLQPVQNSLQTDSVLAQLAQLKSTLTSQRDILRAQLANLLGTTPEQLPQITAPAQWQTLNLPNVIPAAILARRPDIAAAQHYIVAAAENINAAKAEFYPNINLNLGIGLQAIGLDRLLKVGSRYDTVEPALTLPIFSGAGLNANLRNKQAQLDSAIASYNQTVYKAINEAAEQLAQYRNSAIQITQQQRIHANAQKLAQLSAARFAQGVTPQMDSLIAKSVALREQDALQTAYAQRRVQEARLAVSLGRDTLYP